MKTKKVLSTFVSAMMVFGMTVTPIYAAGGTATGTQKAYIVGDDWGCGVTKTVMTLDQVIDADSVDVTDFKVVQTLNGSNSSERTLVDAYVSTKDGDEVTTNSKYVTIEMAISPEEGNPVVYSGVNNWADPYELEVSLADGATLESAGSEITALSVDPVIDVAGDGKICPQIEDFTISEYTYDSTTVSYAFYAPEEDGSSKPLVIWNHGGGETGTDAQIALLANKATVLADEDFQGTMGGAYVLVPQRRTGANSSASAETIYQLVLKLLRENPSIDPNRIIVGGCSAGGAMTMTMLFQHPDLYAAAYPICPATQSASVTDEMIESIKEVPIWFIHAENDGTCNPNTTSKPLAERLTAAGAEVHESYFSDVHDTTGRFFLDENNQFTTTDTGKPYTYDGHWSWTYFYNNKCEDKNGVNLWSWMSKQTKLDNNMATGTQKAYIIGDDWGPAVTKTIITMDKAIDAASLDANDFSVVEEKEATVDWATGEVGLAKSARKVTNIYASDENGNEVTTSSKYITIEMEVDPNTGSPFIYSLTSGFNSWCDPYKLYVTLNDGAVVTSEGKELTSVSIKETIDVAGDEKIVPQVDGIFDVDLKYTAKDGTVYNYAQYVPAKDDNKHALVIWLHGAGEGTNNGENDSYIDLLGNEVTAFASDEFQDLFDNAYVLVPQAATMWMDGGNGVYQNGDKGSIYTESLMEMIEAYVDNNPDIDPNRVIIGGCSNGGYMTMEMILTYPDYFAAAFPICEAYQDQYITDEQIESIKDMPIWFTYAKNDGTVNPTLCVEPTVERLLAAGAKNVHVSAFDDVHDTTGRFTTNGEPYQYNGHWSWVYFDNNECYDGQLNAWEWLSKQVKTVSDVTTDEQPSAGTTDKPSTQTPSKPGVSVTTGDDTAWMGLGIMMVLSAATYTVVRKRYH